MGKKFKYREKVITPAIQSLHIKKTFPAFIASFKRGTAVWVGELQPTPLSKKYKVKIQYTPRKPPQVLVVSPALKNRSDSEKIPHTYSGKRLCLYLPGSGEWSMDMLISKTIIPWTVLWLYYYEVWHATGKWLGGGVHPARFEGKSEDDE